MQSQGRSVAWDTHVVVRGPRAPIAVQADTVGLLGGHGEWPGVGSGNTSVRSTGDGLGSQGAGPRGYPSLLSAEEGSSAGWAAIRPAGLRSLHFAQD